MPLEEVEKLLAERQRHNQAQYKAIAAQIEKSQEAVQNRGDLQKAETLESQVSAEAARLRKHVQKRAEEWRKLQLKRQQREAKAQIGVAAARALRARRLKRTTTVNSLLHAASAAPGYKGSSARGENLRQNTPGNSPLPPASGSPVTAVRRRLADVEFPEYEEKTDYSCCLRRTLERYNQSVLGMSDGDQVPSTRRAPDAPLHSLKSNSDTTSTPSLEGLKKQRPRSAKPGGYLSKLQASRSATKQTSTVLRGPDAQNAGVECFPTLDLVPCERTPLTVCARRLRTNARLQRRSREVKAVKLMSMLQEREERERRAQQRKIIPADRKGAQKTPQGQGDTSSNMQVTGVGNPSKQTMPIHTEAKKEQSNKNQSPERTAARLASHSRKMDDTKAQGHNSIVVKKPGGNSINEKGEAPKGGKSPIKSGCSEIFENAANSPVQAGLKPRATWKRKVGARKKTTSSSGAEKNVSQAHGSGEPGRHKGSCAKKGTPLKANSWRHVPQRKQKEILEPTTSANSSDPGRHRTMVSLARPGLAQRSMRARRDARLGVQPQSSDDATGFDGVGSLEQTMTSLPEVDWAQSAPSGTSPRFPVGLRHGKKRSKNKNNSQSIDTEDDFEKHPAGKCDCHQQSSSRSRLPVKEKAERKRCGFSTSMPQRRAIALPKTCTPRQRGDDTSLQGHDSAPSQEKPSRTLTLRLKTRQDEYENVSQNATVLHDLETTATVQGKEEFTQGEGRKGRTSGAAGVQQQEEKAKVTSTPCSSSSAAQQSDVCRKTKLPRGINPALKNRHSPKKSLSPPKPITKPRLVRPRQACVVSAQTQGQGKSSPASTNAEQRPAVRVSISTIPSHTSASLDQPQCFGDPTDKLIEGHHLHFSAQERDTEEGYVDENRNQRYLPVTATCEGSESTLLTISTRLSLPTTTCDHPEPELDKEESGYSLEIVESSSQIDTGEAHQLDISCRSNSLSRSLSEDSLDYDHLISGRSTRKAVAISNKSQACASKSLEDATCSGRQDRICNDLGQKVRGGERMRDNPQKIGYVKRSSSDFCEIPHSATLGAYGKDLRAKLEQKSEDLDSRESRVKDCSRGLHTPTLWLKNSSDDKPDKETCSEASDEDWAIDTSEFVEQEEADDNISCSQVEDEKDDDLTLFEAATFCTTSQDSQTFCTNQENRTGESESTPSDAEEHDGDFDSRGASPDDSSPTTECRLCGHIVSPERSASHATGSSTPPGQRDGGSRTASTSSMPNSGDYRGRTPEQHGEGEEWYWSAEQRSNDDNSEQSAPVFSSCDTPQHCACQQTTEDASVYSDSEEYVCEGCRSKGCAAPAIAFPSHESRGSTEAAADRIPSHVYTLHTPPRSCTAPVMSASDSRKTTQGQASLRVHKQLSNATGCGKQESQTRTQESSSQHFSPRSSDEYFPTPEHVNETIDSARDSSSTVRANKAADVHFNDDDSSALQQNNELAKESGSFHYHQSNQRISYPQTGFNVSRRHSKHKLDGENSHHLLRESFITQSRYECAYDERKPGHRDEAELHEDGQTTLPESCPTTEGSDVFMARKSMTEVEPREGVERWTTRNDRHDIENAATQGDGNKINAQDDQFVEGQRNVQALDNGSNWRETDHDDLKKEQGSLSAQHCEQQIFADGMEEELALQNTEGVDEHSGGGDGRQFPCQATRGGDGATAGPSSAQDSQGTSTSDGRERTSHSPVVQRMQYVPKRMSEWRRNHRSFFCTLNDSDILSPNGPLGFFHRQNNGLEPPTDHGHYSDSDDETGRTDQGVPQSTQFDHDQGQGSFQQSSQHLGNGSGIANVQSTSAAGDGGPNILSMPTGFDEEEEFPLWARCKTELSNGPFSFVDWCRLQQAKRARSARCSARRARETDAGEGGEGPDAAQPSTSANTSEANDLRVVSTPSVDDLSASDPHSQLQPTTTTWQALRRQRSRESPLHEGTTQDDKQAHLSSDSQPCSELERQPGRVICGAKATQDTSAQLSNLAQSFPSGDQTSESNDRDSCTRDGPFSVSALEASLRPSGPPFSVSALEASLRPSGPPFSARTTETHEHLPTLTDRISGAEDQCDSTTRYVTSWSSRPKGDDKMAGSHCGSGFNSAVDNQQSQLQSKASSSFSNLQASADGPSSEGQAGRTSEAQPRPAPLTSNLLCSSRPIPDDRHPTFDRRGHDENLSQPSQRFSHQPQEAYRPAAGTTDHYNGPGFPGYQDGRVPEPSWRRASKEGARATWRQPIMYGQASADTDVTGPQRMPANRTFSMFVGSSRRTPPREPHQGGQLPHTQPCPTVYTDRSRRPSKPFGGYVPLPPINACEKTVTNATYSIDPVPTPEVLSQSNAPNPGPSQKHPQDSRDPRPSRPRYRDAGLHSGPANDLKASESCTVRSVYSNAATTLTESAYCDQRPREDDDLPEREKIRRRYNSIASTAPASKGFVLTGRPQRNASSPRETREPTALESQTTHHHHPTPQEPHWNWKGYYQNCTDHFEASLPTPTSRTQLAMDAYPVLPPVGQRGDKESHNSLCHVGRNGGNPEDRRGNVSETYQCPEDPLHRRRDDRGDSEQGAPPGGEFVDGRTGGPRQNFTTESRRIYRHEGSDGLIPESCGEGSSVQYLLRSKRNSCRYAGETLQNGPLTLTRTERSQSISSSSNNNNVSSTSQHHGDVASGADRPEVKLRRPNTYIKHSRRHGTNLKSNAELQVSTPRNDKDDVSDDR